MAKDVQVSRALLGALTGALFLSLLLVAFLLGRETAKPAAHQTPSIEVAASPPAPAPVEQRLDERLDRIEQRVTKVQERETLRVGAIPDEEPVSSSPVTTSKPAKLPDAPRQTPSPNETMSSHPENKAYFREVDAILQNTPSLQNPNEFATKFLQRAMNGDQSEFNSLIATTRGSRAQLQAVTPPPSCREHHSLLLRQIELSEELLVEIQGAIANNDTSKLTAVASRGEAMQAENARLQELERELRR